MATQDECDLAAALERTYRATPPKGDPFLAMAQALLASPNAPAVADKAIIAEHLDRGVRDAIAYAERQAKQAEEKVARWSINIEDEVERRISQRLPRRTEDEERIIRTARQIVDTFGHLMEEGRYLLDS